MADCARLESVFTLIGNGGSNPPLSANIGSSLFMVGDTASSLQQQSFSTLKR